MGGLSKQNKQSPRDSRVNTKTRALAAAKTRFLRSLENNGGNVSAALRSSGLNRNAAYNSFRDEPEFAEQWCEAIANATDDLLAEARRRAVFVGSDRLLIFLIEKHEREYKWRQRLITAGTLAGRAVKEAGVEEGLTEEQIGKIQQSIIESLDKVSLS